MPTIRTAISIFDGATQPLRHMHNAINAVLNSFQAMQTASANAVDVSAIHEAQREMALAGASFDEIEQRIQASDRAQQNFNRSVHAGSSAANGLLGIFRSLVPAIGGAMAIKKLVGLSDELSGTQARLTMLVDDGGSVSELERKIMASANRSRAAYLDTAAAVSKLGLMAGDAFANNDEIIAFTEAVNKQFVIAGATASEQKAAMLQLTQAMASGVLRGDELNSIFEQAPNLIQNIADYLGEPIGNIRKLASEGKITADIIKNAMFRAADSINERFETMPLTWGQVFTLAGNAALQALRPLLSGISWLANNIQIIGPAVLALAGAFTVFQVAAHWAAIASAVAAVYHGAINFLSIGFGMLSGSAAAASSAVFTFNSALLASPVTWWVMLIIVLIGVLYAAVAAVNKFKGTSISATGLIGSAFAVLGAYLLNTFVVPLHNNFAAVANFLGNVFHNPIAAIKVSFYDMALTVLGYIQKMAAGIETLLNKIPGVSINITSGLDGFYRNLEKAQQAVKDESGWVEYVKKMDFIDYGDAAKAGYKFGEGLVNKVSGFFGGAGGGSRDTPGWNESDGIFSNTGETAANTAAMRDALDSMEEDLTWMIDLAEREAINRVTNNEFHIDMGGITNNLASDMDIDGAVNAMWEQFAEQIASSGEGA